MPRSPVRSCRFRRMRGNGQAPALCCFLEGSAGRRQCSRRCIPEQRAQLNNHAQHMPGPPDPRANCICVCPDGRPRAASLVRQAIERLLAYKRWDYFLDGGEHTIGLQRAPEATIAMVSALSSSARPLPRSFRRNGAAGRGQGRACMLPDTVRNEVSERVRGGVLTEDMCAYRFDLRLAAHSEFHQSKSDSHRGLMMAGCRLYGRHSRRNRGSTWHRQSARLCHHVRA
jgi:hypothetical protein